MVQLYYLLSLGIDTCKARTFVKIAIDACQGEIAWLVFTAMFSGNDVLDLQGCQRRIFLPQLAILAAKVRSLSHELPDRFIHRSNRSLFAWLGV